MDSRADHRPIAERLAERSTPEPNTGCLLWFGHCTRGGYGKLRVDHKEVYVHRLAWELAHGPIPKGLFVCHKCDTPNCIEPSHLFLGSPADNSQDALAKRRLDLTSWTTRGENHPNHKLTDDAVRFIRANCTKRGDQRAMAKRFNVTETLISYVVTRKFWKNI